MAKAELTPAQRKAVEHFTGPMLVIAGAGSGKTTVLAERVAHLVREREISPGSILALTYTNKAAAQLTRRIANAVNDEAATQVQSCTFHSLCTKILERHGAPLVPIEEMDLKVYLRLRWEEMPRRLFVRAADPGEFIKDLLVFISRCQDELVKEKDFRDYVGRLERDASLPLPRVASSQNMAQLSREQVIARCREIADVYEWLRDHLRPQSWGTFGDLVVNSVQLLESHPELLAREQEKVRFILVDEFQDSNFAQVRLLQLLSGAQKNVFAVGDPDQSIYQFRGGNAASFEVFRKIFANTAIVDLDTNYRSLPPILQIGYSVISRNPSAQLVNPAGEAHVRTPLKCGREELARIQSQPLPKCAPQVVPVPDDLTEAALIAARLEQLHGEGAAWSDCAVLYRSHAHREMLVDILAERNIPAEVRGMDLLATPQLRDLCAVLDALQDFGDSTALLRVAALPHFQIDPADLRHALVTSKTDSLAAALPAVRGGEAVLEALRKSRAQVDAANMEARGALELIVRNFALPESQPLQTFRRFVDSWLRKPTTAEKSFTSFCEYFCVYRQFDGGVCENEDKDEPGANTSAKDAVQLMTVHKAKGLEFPHVFVPRVNQAAFPKNYKEALFEFPEALSKSTAEKPRTSKELHEDEERRLFYVAVTRAKDFLWIVTKPRGKSLSRYLKDLSEDPTLKDVITIRPLAEPFVRLSASAAPSTALAEWLSMPPLPGLSSRPLSANSIQRYCECPLKFKIAADLSLPGQPSPQLNFGNAVHEALKAYYDFVLAGKTPMLAAVLSTFDARLDAASFDHEGQRALYRNQGHAQLTTFFEARRAAVQPKVMATEKEFNVEIAGVTVRGRMDRIDDLGGGAVAIEDYKTGRAKNQDHADKSLQLSVYALAAMKMGWRPSRLSLYSLEDDRVVLTERSQKQLAAAEEEIKKVAAGIAAGMFEPNPDYHCNWCEYQAICPAQERPLVQIANAAVN